MERLIGTYIFDDEMTANKMLFLTGPRQVGKTTFAKMWLESIGSKNTYFNWDDPSVMMEYKKNPLYFRNVIDEKIKNKPVPLVFDEVHKHTAWRDILKGLYDTNRERMSLLVAGSSRLGFVRKSGDSLVGRYFSYQMFPLGLPEVVGDFSYLLQDERPLTDGESLIRLAREADTKAAIDGLEQLLKFGGFPEPFLKGSDRFHRRWQNDYKALLTKEEVRDFSRIQDIRGLETMVELLPTKVGSNLSIPSMVNVLKISHKTIKNWIEVLKGVYLVFTISPWHRNIKRSIIKEKKLYFFEWSLIFESGSRFENFLAVNLLRMAVRFTEIGLGNFDLFYIRDKEKREVDFVLVKDNEPIALFEAKESDLRISKLGRFYSKKMNIPLFQIVHKAKKVEAFPGNCFIIPATNFLMITG
ncbi:ATP-binding protein [candidate division WOR-3 bacterium]|nr:ATP-binding protein [candidate division WOR-3 bacterium]